MERRTANILLGQSDQVDCFRLKWGWFTFNFKIKPISTRQLISISRELCQVGEFENEDMTYFQALVEHVSDARYINRAIAIATGTSFVRIVSRMISNLPNTDQNTLFKILIKNSDAEVFFYTMVLAKKMNILKKPEQ